MTARLSRLRGVLVALASLAVVSASALPGVAAPTSTVFEPKIEVSKTTGVVEGEELIVKGSGFDPAANVSTRVPVTPGQPAGVYVVFGSFADVWQPSTGADAYDPDADRHQVGGPATVLRPGQTDFRSEAPDGPAESGRHVRGEGQDQDRRREPAQLRRLHLPGRRRDERGARARRHGDLPGDENTTSRRRKACWTGDSRPRSAPISKAHRARLDHDAVPATRNTNGTFRFPGAPVRRRRSASPGASTSRAMRPSPGTRCSR